MRGMQPLESSHGRGERCSPLVLSISSGKGGVGKTNIVLNLAVEMQRRGHRTLVFDADLGLSNVPILLGLSPEYDLSHVIFGEKSMQEILIEGPEGIRILPAGSGMQELADLKDEQKLKLLCETEMLDEAFDYVLVDTGGGISPNVIFFNIVSQENIIVVYPEPAAIADAYTLMKLLALDYRRKRFLILMNGTAGREEELQILDRLTIACQRFLKASVSYLGAVPYDDLIRKSIRMQIPVVQQYPQAPASRSLCGIAERLVSLPVNDFQSGSLRLFWKRSSSSDPWETLHHAQEICTSTRMRSSHR